MTGAVVVKIGRGVKCLNPIRWLKMGLEKKSAHYIVDSVNSTFCFAILGRRMQAKHVKTIPLEEKNERVVELLNSRPLSHCTD
jgi:hypothetical protein